MAKQIFRQMKAEGDDLEWLYVPDVVYAKYETCKRCLQLIIPYRHVWKTEETFPLVIFIPGSAWYRQEVYNSIPAYSRLAERGFVTAILQFRESKIAPFPAQLQDTKAAVRFLSMKAEAFHIDTTQIYLAGNSSGGHIALLTALTAAHGEYESELYPDSDYEIKGVIAESAPTDILKCAASPAPDSRPAGFRPTRDLLGVREVMDNPELAKAASCEKYIGRDICIPPVLLFHGTDDEEVSIENSRELFSLLKAADKEVYFYELCGGNHGGAAFWSSEVLDIIEAFIGKQL